MAAPHVGVPVLRAGGGISPSLLVLLGGGLALFILGLLVAAFRGSTPGM
jgi:hypothetical protein